MNNIAPYLQPIADLWEHFTVDHDFKAATELPGEWHTKFIRNERLKVNKEYSQAWKRFYGEPDVYDTLCDNAYRFSLLAFAERWIAVRQAQQYLKTRFTMSNNNVGALNAVRSQGLLGSFRGNLWNIFHFVGVHFHALWYANNDPLKYIGLSTLFEAALYPIDTIRTLYYADVNKSFKNTFDCVTKTVERGGLSQFYRGIDFKLVYNVFFGLNLWSISNDSPLQYVTYPLWLISYGLLSMKTRLQIAGSSLSVHNAEASDIHFDNIMKKEGIRGLFHGFIPFVVLNVAFMYSFPGLFSEEKKRHILGGIRDKAPIPKQELKYWA